MLRAVREIQPAWVVGENVPGIISWNGGMVFDEVQADLEAEGYEVLPVVLPACGVNAPHRRDRVWFVANSRDIRCGRQDILREQQGGAETFGTGKTGLPSNRQKLDEPTADTAGLGRRSDTKIGLDKSRNVLQNSGGEESADQPIGVSEGRIIADTASGRSKQINRLRKSEQFNKMSSAGEWSNFPTQPPVYSGDDGFPSRLDGITVSKWRNESIKASGNAIVPQVAYQIFKAIEQTEQLLIQSH